MTASTASRSIPSSDTLPTHYVGADQVILVSAELALVSSKSEPGRWRQVDAQNLLCACPGHLYRGHCRHVEAVRAALEEEAPAETCTCGGPVTVSINGSALCGTCAPLPGSKAHAVLMSAPLPRGFVR